MDELELRAERAREAVRRRQQAVKDAREELKLSDEVDANPTTRDWFSDTALGVVRGPLKAVKSMYGAIEGAAEWVIGNTGDIRVGFKNWKPTIEVQSPEEARTANEAPDMVQRGLGATIDAVPETQTGVGGAAEGITQFITGLIPVARGTQALKILQGGGAATTVARGLTESAVTSAFAFEGAEKNIADLINATKQEGGVPDLSNAVSDYLSDKTDDSELEKRLKNALADAIVGAPIEGVMAMFRYVKAGRAAKASGDLVPPSVAPKDTPTVTPDVPAERIELTLADPTEPLRAPAATIDENSRRVAAANERAAKLTLEGDVKVDEVAPKAQAKVAALEKQADEAQALADQAKAAIEETKPRPFRELTPDEQYEKLRSQLGITDAKLSEFQGLVQSGKVKPEQVADLIGANPERIDWTGVNDAADMVGMLNSLTRILGDVTGEAAGYARVSLDTIAKQAQDLGGSFDNAVEMWQSTRGLAARVQSARAAEMGSASLLQKLAKKIANAEHTPQDLLDFVTHEKRHALLQTVVRGSKAEIGRALRVMREGVGVNESALKLANGKRLRIERKARELAARTKETATQVRQATQVAKTLRSQADSAVAEAEKKQLTLEEAEKAAREFLDDKAAERMAGEVKNAKAVKQAELTKARQEAREAAQAAKKATAEAKRAEDAANKLADSSNAADVTLTGDVKLQLDEVEEALRSMGLKSDEVVDLAKMVSQMESKAATNLASRTGLWMKAQDRISFLYINSILSGMQTLALNVGSGLFKMAESVFEHWGAAATAIARGGDQLDAIVAKKATVATVTSWKSALIAARDAWKEGLPQTDLIARAEVEARGGLGGSLAAKAISVPSRAILTVDEFFKHIFYKQEISARAVEVAAAAARIQPNKALRKKVFAKVMQETLSNPPDDIILDAIEKARESTFQAGLESKLANNIIKMTNDTPIAKLVVPFVKTPLNILKQGLLERSPLALLRRQVWKDIAEGGRKGNTAAVRAAVGVATFGTVWSLAEEGRITGSKKGSGTTRNTADSVEVPPYSVYISGTWYQYSKADPIGLVMGLTADLRLLFREYEDANNNAAEGDNMDLPNAFGNILGILNENLLDKTFFKGISDLVAFMSGSGGAGGPAAAAGNYVSNVLTGLVPYSSFFGQLARSNDEYAREAFSTMEKLQAKFPLWNEKLPPKRDVLGRPIPTVDRLGPDWISPYIIGRDDNDPAAQALVEAGLTYSPAEKDIAGIKLSAEQYSRLTQIQGEFLREQLTEFINSGEWAGLTNYRKAAAFRAWRSAGKDKAEAVLFEEYPDLKMAVEGRMLETRQLRSGELEQ